MANIFKSMFVFLKCIWTDMRVWFSQWRLAMDRRLAENGTKQLWRILLLCVAFTGLIGFILFLVYGSICISTLKLNYSETPFVPDNVFDAAYFLLFTNGGQNLFDGSHILGFIFTTIGIVLVAFLTSTITNALERRSQRYLDGETDYLMSKHIVVFGASDYLYSIINEKSGINRRNEECRKLQKELDDKNNKKEKAPRQKYLIVTSRDVASLRREVFSFLDKRIDRRDFVFFFGDRTSDEDISKLSLERATEVFVIGDSMESDDIESYRDANNMDCVEAIGRYLKQKGNPPITQRVYDMSVNIGESGSKKVQYKQINKKNGSPLPCHVMFEYQTSFAAFQFSEISDDIKKYVHFMPFNFYDLWARKVIVSGKSTNLKYKFLDTVSENGDTKSYINEDSTKTVHLIIIGMTKMGIAMALQAAHVCHYPNFKSNEKNKKRTRISFIDSNADTELDYFKGRFPSLMSNSRTRFLDFSKRGCLDNITTSDAVEWRKNNNYKWSGDINGWYDIEWEFVKGRVESDSIQSFISKAAQKKEHIVTIAVCLPKSHQSIAAAMYLPTNVYEDCLQILTYQRRSGSIVNTLADTPVPQKEQAKYKKLIPFGMVDEGYDSSLDNDKRAMLVSYVYDSYYALKKTPSIVWKNLDGKPIPLVVASEYKVCDYKFTRYESEFVDWDNDVFYCIYNEYQTKWYFKYISDKMSSAFNANTIETKLRGLDILATDSCPDSFNQSQVETLIRVEHNRWNIEKMLTGFRSLTAEESRQMFSLRELYLKLDKDEAIILSSKENKLLLELRDMFVASINEKMRKGKDVYDDEKYNLALSQAWDNTTSFDNQDSNSRILAKDLVKTRWTNLRKQKKGWPYRAHLDICSCEELSIREEQHIIDFDKYLSEAIPVIYKKTSGNKK